MYRLWLGVLSILFLALPENAQAKKFIGCEVFLNGRSVPALAHKRTLNEQNAAAIGRDRYAADIRYALHYNETTGLFWCAMTENKHSSFTDFKVNMNNPSPLKATLESWQSFRDPVKDDALRTVTAVCESKNSGSRDAMECLTKVNDQGADSSIEQVLKFGPDGTNFILNDKVTTAKALVEVSSDFSRLKYRLSSPGKRNGGLNNLVELSCVVTSE